MNNFEQFEREAARREANWLCIDSETLCALDDDESGAECDDDDYEGDAL